MTFLPSKDSVLSAAEDMGAIAKEAIRQRDEAREALATQLEIAQTWAAVAAENVAENERQHARVAELEAELEHVRGIVFDVDMRGAVQALLKSEMSAGELRRALGELVR